MKITRYTNLALFKTDNAPTEPNQKLPYYELIAKENKDATTKVFPGKFWFKQTEKGLNYFSGSMAEARTYEGKEYDGYVIVSVKELNALEEASNRPTVEGKGMEDITAAFTGAATNPQDIPF